MTRPSTAFKATWVRKIAEHHLWLLESHGLHLPGVSIALMRSSAHWGTWEADRHVISINERLVLEHPWPAVLGIVGHETAHQVVTDLGEDGKDLHCA